MSTLRNGFSLIELLVVMSIISIIVSLIGPDSLKVASKAKQYTELQSVHSLIRSSSKYALYSSQPVVLEFNGKDK